MAGILITPDLDVDYTASNAVVADISRLLAVVWRLYWWLYARIPHRHWLSHGLIVGTLVRVIYAVPLLWPLYRHLPRVYLIAALAGLITVDNLHVGCDWLSTTIRTKKKPR